MSEPPPDPPARAPALALVLAALVSFAIGFAAMRGMPRAASTPAAVAPPRAVATPPPALKKVDDPSAAAQKRIDSVFTLGGGFPGHARDAALYEALRKLEARDFLAAAADFPALLTRLNKNGWATKGGNQEHFVEAWMDRWLAIDTPGAREFLGSSPLLSQLATSAEKTAGKWNTMQAAAIRALARRELRWTHGYVAAQPAGPRREAAVHALLEQAARQDAAQARQFLASYSAGANRTAALEGYVTGLAAADARAGFEAAWAEPGPLRGRLIDLAMGEAGKRGAATASELLDRFAGPEQRLLMAQKGLEAMRRRATGDLLPWIVEETQRMRLDDGFAAANWANTVGYAVQGARTGPAAEWAAALANDPQRRVFGRIAGAWVERDPDGLRTWLAGSAATLDAAALEALGAPLTKLMRGDAATTQTWADALPPGRLREQVQY